MFLKSRRIKLFVFWGSGSAEYGWILVERKRTKESKQIIIMNKKKEVTRKRK